MLLPLLERLHDDHCKRDKANNRELHFDMYCMLALLYMFNPTVTSSRAIAQASELAKVQNILRNHRMLVDQSVDGAKADETNLRDDQLLLHGSSERSGTDRSSSKAQAARRGTISEPIKIAQGALHSMLFCVECCALSD
ncbi:hypothetical protein SH449x_003453 [Pirellulaceae bacterium SH449]